MSLRSPVEKAIWFIESHFSEEITLDDVAGVCGLSRFQTSRLFTSTSGQTMSGYLRGRRLTEAARELAQGAPNILAVAIEAGYNSHEAFSRAFIQQFGDTPSQVRDRGGVDGLALVEPMREDPAVLHRLAPPTVRRREQLLVAGISRRFPVDDFAGIPSLWQDLRAFDDVIPGQLGSTRYGVINDMSAGGADYMYLGGVEVAAGTEVHHPLSRIALPAGRWATFTHAGHITTIASTIRAIFVEALPAAGLTPQDAPDLLEIYPETFDPRSGLGGVELSVPLRDR
ncbi:AraC family transcriptional regulator [Nocardioides glacieisoli]|uniref:AraC family transcriptional regulator n=1 Tax=Nocardioides glacieisoli TaxID=1168730 RepID=A0A4Q2RLX0_9ACTN|nr:helix-turn-helix domain-containing protein [Nocardioides glacieisoli]RYB88565.1 AraC family transcriptional regulator [Nocardioides glacieisoli]